MAVAVGAVGGPAAGDSVNTLAWNHTVAAGANRLLTVGLSTNQTTAAAITSFDYGGVPLTFLGVVGNGGAAEIWYLIAPAVGTAAITVVWDDVLFVVGGSISYTGVHQSVPLGTAVTATGNSRAVSVNVTGVSISNLVMDVVHVFAATTNPSLAVGAGQTSRWNTSASVSPQIERGACSTEPSAVGAVTMSWAIALLVNKLWATIAAEVKQAPSTVLRDPLRGPGLVVRAR